MAKLAIFDFDGTITIDDSLIKFLCFAKGHLKFYLGMLILSPMLVAYKCKIISNDNAKQYLLSYFLRDMQLEDFSSLATEYALNHIDRITRDLAMQKILWHKEQGHKVVVVSASIEAWIKPWCDSKQIDLLATKLEYTEQCLTGKFSSPNCYGAEKVKRLKIAYDIDSFDYIYAYGDSRGDREMLELADEKNFKPFRQ